MKAGILVVGQRTRLLPLTCYTPKAMVPVLNIPFLEHVTCHLTGHQIKDIILTQSHLAWSIDDYLGDGSQLEARLSYVMEDTLLRTARIVKNVEKHLDETLLMLIGNIFTDLDITAIIDHHKERKAKAIITLTSLDDSLATA